MKQCLVSLGETVSRLRKMPETYIVLGSVVGLGTAAFASYAHRKAQLEVDALYLDAFEAGDENPVTLEKKLAKTWKYYVPTALLGLTSLAVIGYGAKMGYDQRKTVEFAYRNSSRIAKTLKASAKEVLSEKNFDKVIGNASDKIMEDAPTPSQEVVEYQNTDTSKTLCYDTVSGRYFYSSIGELYDAEQAINRKLKDEMWVPLNDLYDMLGMETISIGETLGWSVDSSWLEFSWSTRLNDDKLPALVVMYEIDPQI